MDMFHDESYKVLCDQCANVQSDPIKESLYSGSKYDQKIYFRFKVIVKLINNQYRC